VIRLLTPHPLLLGIIQWTSGRGREEVTEHAVVDARIALVDPAMHDWQNQFISMVTKLWGTTAIYRVFHKKTSVSYFHHFSLKC